MFTMYIMSTPIENSPQNPLEPITSPREPSTRPLESITSPLEPITSPLEPKEEKKILRSYGFKPDLPLSSKDKNLMLTAHSSVRRRFPKKLELINLPPVYDQGALGSCTSQSLSAAFQYEQRRQNLPDYMPSRLFIYYNERSLEGTINIDSGAALSDGIKSMTNLGVASEEKCPYIIEKFAEKPSDEAYRFALDHQVIKSSRVNMTVNDFKTMINLNVPIAFGFTVYESFEDQETARTGIMKVPDTTKEECLGGHAVLCIGYDDLKTSADKKTVGYLKVRNSWGSSWGSGGYFYMPYDVIKNGLACDGWAIMQNESTMRLNRQMSEPIYRGLFEKIRELIVAIKKIHIGSKEIVVRVPKFSFD
jgi:C1A family cysteine protease